MTPGFAPTSRRLAVSAYVARAPSAHTAARSARKEISHG